jgi:hypothetical protein
VDRISFGVATDVAAAMVRTSSWPNWLDGDRQLGLFRRG